MNIQIRENVFETNSSSSHSVVVSGDVAAGFGLSKDELRSGVIDLSYVGGEFGWSYSNYSDTKSKIVYLLIQAVGSYPEEISKDTNGQAERILRVIEGLTGCTLQFPDKLDDWYIDHQSMGECNDILDDDDMIAVFLFSDSSYFETGNDN